jgi:hypothetical protein
MTAFQKLLFGRWKDVHVHVTCQGRVAGAYHTANTNIPYLCLSRESPGHGTRISLYESIIS